MRRFFDGTLTTDVLSNSLPWPMQELPNQIALAIGFLYRTLGAQLPDTSWIPGTQAISSRLVVNTATLGLMPAWCIPS
jgi:hypothetical protein